MFTAHLNKILKLLLCVFLFLLPWQTRWIYAPAFLNGANWEYGTLSIYATEFLLGLIVILALVDLIRRRVWRTVPDPARARQRLIGFGAGLLFLLFLILTSRAPAVSAQWVSWAIAGAAAAALIWLYGAGHIKLQAAFWLGGVGQGLFALYQFFTQEVVANKWLGLSAHAPWQLGDFVIEFGGERWLRAYGAFGSPNILGGYLAVCLVLGLMLCVRLAKPLPGPPLCEGEGAQNPLGRSGGGRPPASLCEAERAGGRIRTAVTIGQLIILSGLLLSFSRGAWLAAGVGVIIFLIVATRPLPALPLKGEEAAASPPFKEGIEEWSRHSLLAKQLLFSLAIILVFWLFLRPLFFARLAGSGRLEQQSMESRVNQYQEFKQVFSVRPLLGVGPGAYTYAAYQLDSSRPGWRYQPVHNAYLLMLAEIGVAGFIFFLTLNCYIVKLLHKKNQFFLSALAVVFISALFDHFWWSLYGGVVVWGVIWGLSTRPVVDNGKVTI